METCISKWYDSQHVSGVDRTNIYNLHYKFGFICLTVMLHIVINVQQILKIYYMKMKSVPNNGIPHRIGIIKADHNVK